MNIKQLLKVAHHKKVVHLDLDKKEVTVIESKASENTLCYLRELLKSFVDSYQIVAQTI